MSNTSQEIEETIHKATVGGMLAADSTKLPAVKGLAKTKLEALGTYLFLNVNNADLGIVIAQVLKAAYFLRK